MIIAFFRARWLRTCVAAGLLQDGSKMPRIPGDGPKMTQDGPRWPQEKPSKAQESPKERQDDPKVGRKQKSKNVHGAKAGAHFWPLEST